MILSRNEAFSVTELYRYAVKGLSGDPLTSVDLSSGRFPDDRRYALLKASRDWPEGEWLHKDNFLCAFTQPRLLASLHSSYQNGILELVSRESQECVLGPIDLTSLEGRQQLASYMSNVSGEKVRCIQSETFHFGNTSSGMKNRKDSRVVHIVNQATVDDVAKRTGIRLNASRFRPNIVIQDAPAWAEFSWIGKTLVCTNNQLRLTVLSKTVRCDGVSVDPKDPTTIVDVPKLLTDYFPEHGPFLGIYAAIDEPAHLSLGDQLQVLN
jgi:hypothetical protein